MTLLKTCPDCGRRSRFSLCTVCFTRQTEPPTAYEAISGPALSRLYVAAKERAEFYDLLQRDLWHLTKGGPVHFNADYDVG